MLSVLIAMLGIAALACWLVAATAALAVVGLAPRGQKLKAYVDLGWWRFAAVERIAGAAARAPMARYRKAFIGFFASIAGLMATSFLLIIERQN
jgi:hypothetical protein